ncbi:MAG: hypothetical protein FD161_1614 [Limisphaerales bacterium]|nr:MAG: hypothetical protein FD161_1614 [Limisphaerales bacterium]KAG0509223.1 MAG: hypothetical protein E1N63_1533 [Limisphaerales bacterium]TXT52238.1 MAG: hypothetical protein FD140_981 [Limisphaerales bacterium]
MLALLVEGEAKNIAAEHLKGEVSPETLERVKFSLREFSAMIEEGAEIHPALQAPESVKNLFPNFKDLMGIESRTKLIEDEKKDTSN